jgi:hypothetical protein
VARAVLTADRYAEIEVHDWTFGGASSTVAVMVNSGSSPATGSRFRRKGATEDACSRGVRRARLATRQKQLCGSASGPGR